MIETAATAEIPANRLADSERVDLLASWAFTGMHLAALGVLVTGFSWVALVVCLVTLWGRMFGITGAYHRYFAHRSYRTSRPFQFVLAWLGASAGQNGPMWWVSHHRHHHRHADTEKDVHPPGVKGLWWAHAGWILCRKYKGYDARLVRDLARYPELRFLERNHMLAPLGLAVSLWLLGWWLESRAPGLGTGPWQLLTWGFFLSTVLLYHMTFLVNSVAHTWGSRRFDTRDDSRNNWWVALLTLGEGWRTTTTTDGRVRSDRASTGGSWTSRITSCSRWSGSVSSGTFAAHRIACSSGRAVGRLVERNRCNFDHRSRGWQPAIDVSSTRPIRAGFVSDVAGRRGTVPAAAARPRAVSHRYPPGQWWSDARRRAEGGRA